MSVKITPFGPTQATLDEIARDVLRLTEVKKHLQKTRHRLLSVSLVESEAELKHSRLPATPSRFRATIYDYTNNRTLLVDGRLARPRKVEITDSASQPLPTREEFEEAVQILMRHEQLGPGIREQQLQPYPPMPPLLGEQLPDGRTERTIAVGLLPIKGEHHHEIVGVNMSRRTIIRFENHAPSSAQAHNPICGLPYANQTTASNVPGQVWITVKQGSTTLWKFLAVRPGASSGTNGSGVELRFVDYRGKRVLYNGHNLVAYSAGKSASIALKSSQVTRYRWSFPHTI